MTQKYSIGLDIGTNSVGWAVVDENNELVRYKKKNMWGSRLFEAANPAEGRRINRSARRRLKRRAQRINFLQQLLAPMVLLVDDGFFMKMNESMLHADDQKFDPLKASLEQAGYYQKDNSRLKYPTMYHLRKALMESDEQFDPPLVYLAIHHIIKYRGNFLYQGQSFDINSTQHIDENLTQSFEFLEDNFGISLADLASRQADIIAILRQSNKSKSQRKSDIMALFNLEKIQKSALEQVIKAFLGLTVNLHQIFSDLDKQSLDFSKFEEKREANDEALNGLSGEQLDYLELLQRVHSWVILQGVLRGGSSVSQAMISKYDDYARDLKFVKSLFKKHLSTHEYKEFFKSKEDAKGQHSHYTKYSESGWSYDEFIKDFKKYYEKAVENGADMTTAEAARFIDRLENREAFAKLRMSDNGAIPYQLHKDELIKIIEKQGQFYPELLETVDNGDGKEKYKLVRLIEHRIPYYVGPLQTSDKNKSEFSWMKRKENGDITPFNFYQKVDKLGSAEAFITNLTNNCTYLPDKPVLPKYSLLMSEFSVRNEIKNMRIDGEPVSIDFENGLFRDVFLRKKKVTTKDVMKYLRTSHHAIMVKNSHPEITGLSDKAGFHSSMSSYIDFTDKIGLDITLETSNPTYQMVENLIQWVTIFEDKGILKEKIKLEYGDRLSEMQIEQIVKRNYSGWASLSRELLTEIKSHPRGSVYGQSIIELMRTEPANFKQITSSEKFGIKSKLDAALEKFMADEEKTDYDLVRDLPASPSVKRGIWQAIKLVKEIVELQDGQKPEKIYIEMAKGSNGSDQTMKRKRAIEKLYEKVELDGKYVTKEDLKQLKYELKEFQKIDKRAWELYFRQLGKCAYSGKPIDPSQIAQTCQIDHIIPRSLVKDDSLDNKVLVLSAENQRKRESYPLDQKIIGERAALWRYWQDNGLMSPAKFARLTQTQEKYDKDMVSGGFIKRQLVETRQITKHVAGLFDRIYTPESGKSIVEPVKARITSEFRDKFDFPKSRSINDFHHAKDAYLTAVLGRYLAAKFDNRKRSVLYERYMSFQKDELINQSERQQREARELGFVLWGIDKKENLNKETGEITDGEQRMKTIGRTMRFNDCLVTKKTELNESGQLFDATLYKKTNTAKAKIARGKGLSVAKYGGHTSDKMAYMAAVELIDTKGKIVRKLVKIPLRIALVAASDDELVEWLKNELNAKQVKIVKNKIPKFQIIKTKDGSMLTLTSQADAGNFKQLRLPYATERWYAHLQKVFAGLEKISFDDATLARKVYYHLPDLVVRSGETGAYRYEFVDDAEQKIGEFFNELYRLLLDKIKVNVPFYGSQMIGKLEMFYRDFAASEDLSQKFHFLEEMLILSSGGPSYPSFEKIDISKQYFKSGTGKITTKTFYLDDIIFYQYSITGLKLKKQRL